MRTRLLVTALALAAAGLPANAIAAAPPALAREVTLTGAGAGFVRVRLTQATQFARTQPEIVRVSDHEMLAGVLLIREQRSNHPGGIGVVALPPDSGRPYAPVYLGAENGFATPNDYAVWYRRTLQPGTYRLYLLTRRSARVSVTVRFPVASGRSAFAVPTNTTAAATATLAPGVPGQAVAPAHAHSSRFALPRRGLLMPVMWWRGDVTAIDRADLCFYDGELPDAAPTTPVCPAAPGGVAIGGPFLLPTPDRATNFYLYVPPGRWLQKAGFQIAGNLRYGGVQLVSLDLGAGFPVP